MRCLLCLSCALQVFPAFAQSTPEMKVERPVCVGPFLSEPLIKIPRFSFKIPLFSSDKAWKMRPYVPQDFMGLFLNNIRSGQDIWGKQFGNRFDLGFTVHHSRGWNGDQSDFQMPKAPAGAEFRLRF
jgi:hypothetical protein